MSERLLVYGLLRQGLSLSGLMEGSISRGTVRVGGFELFDLGDYPGVVRGEGELVAELYELPAPWSWEALDEAEGLGEDPPYYRRELVQLDDGAAQLYVYARPLGDAPRIPSGDWLQREQR